MTIRLVILCFFFTTKFGNAQNLVYNGSFEEITQCNSNKFLFYDYVVGWMNPCQINGHNSDYYNTTCPPLPNMDKIPFDGNGLFGLATYSSTQTYPAGITNFHEFVQGTLVTPLTVGSTYCVSFKVAALQANWASDKIGALFTTVPYNSSTPPYEALTNFAHVFSNTIINDTNWTTVSGSFVADDAYQYILLGNFFADNLTNHLSSGAYYWIDDVRVMLDPNGDCSALNNTTYHVSQNLTICANDTLILPGGTVVNTSGIYIDTLQASNGSDSIITTTLNVLPHISNTVVSKSICQGDYYNFGGSLLSVSGTYTDTLISVSTSCDSIVILNLSVLPTIPLTEIFETICAGSTYLFDGNLLTQPGIYTDTLSTGTCDSIVTLHLMVNPAPSVHIVSTVYETGNGIFVQLEAISNTSPLSYLWTSSSVLSNYVISNPTTTIQIPTWAYVTVTDASGCVSTDGRQILIPVTSTLYAPNTFTPNGDEANNIFRAYGTNIAQFKMTIYDRWGELIFESTDILIGWDATYKGKIVQDGIYVYKISAIGMDDINYQKTGHVTIVK